MTIKKQGRKTKKGICFLVCLIWVRVLEPCLTIAAATLT